jgi:hypothetical protein
MSPILTGIIASGISGNLTPPYSGPEGAYDALASVTVPSGGLASVSFANIPTGYKHLQIRMLTIGNGSLTASGFMAINGDSTSSNYYTHYLYGNGSSALAGTNQANFVPFAMGTSAAPGAEILDILDYTNTNKNKVIKSYSGVDANGSGQLSLFSILWNNKSAITSISLSFTTIQQHSSFALYGIK